ncbi:nucleoside deaminase [Amaricoccus macauensis]|uniref:nucleoside deaminase n=1 Tax=Amaricoccus macauensis TaxID=57001 RepID=UPI003C7DCA9D
MYNETFMQRAIEISARALNEPGLEPFGAVIVKDGEIIGEGINRSLKNFDPTSHGETEAIRDACRNLESVDLSGCDLYTSCEPCTLCVSAMAIAGISRLYFAASMDQAGSAFENLTPAERHPIDTDLLVHECSAPVLQRKLPASQALGADAAEILRQWAELKLSEGQKSK